MLLRMSTLKRKLPAELIFQLFSLLISIIIVHAIYVAVIRPNAEVFLKEEAIRLETEENAVQRQSAYVTVKDMEQEICFILFFWALAIIGYKGMVAMREQSLLYEELVPIREGIKILPEDVRGVSRTVQSLPEDQQHYLLPRAVLTALHRFDATRNIQDVSIAVRNLCDTEAERMESGLSMIRYIVWAIPSIGFIGTVRGIGDALGQAYKAVEGDITGVTQSLGVAFNSTLIALLISIVLMLVVHQLQSTQDRLVLDAETYCDSHLIRHLRVS